MLPDMHDRAAIRLRVIDTLAHIDELYAAASLLPESVGIDRKSVV